MEINLLVTDKDTEIEKALGLDEGSLIRENRTYYLGTMHGGEKVTIHVHKVVDGKILLQEIRTAEETAEQVKLAAELDKWIDVLFEINHLPKEAIEKLHFNKWTLTLGDSTIEIPFNATTYNAFRTVLENIRSEL